MKKDDSLDICIKIIEILVRRINSGEDTFNTTNYTNVAHELSKETINNRNISKYMGYISKYCRSIGMPPISAMVKNQRVNLPGNIYFEEFTFYPRGTFRGLKQYSTQLEIIFNTDWDRLLVQIEQDSSNDEFDITNIHLEPEHLGSFGL